MKVALLFFNQFLFPLFQLTVTRVELKRKNNERKILKVEGLIETKVIHFMKQLAVIFLYCGFLK